MARLFIFAIGGTGSRVLKSLTMLLAAGIGANAETEFEIVPVIIDPHKSNDDLKRTERILANYQNITGEIGYSNGFFSTKITTLDKLAATENHLAGSFTFNLQQVANKTFKEYIDFNQLTPQSRALAELLFSGKSKNKRGDDVDLLDIEMDIGFVGNPNVGSVVLNQFKDSDEFKEFASCFNENDRIFIISSIFGGTGAAGFPTILKNIRGAADNPNINGRGFLENAKIGALTVLPYFNVEKVADSPIQKSAFVAKTKAALSYYKENVADSVNALYYIADDHNGKAYKNDPGENGQKNDAHFVELAAALAVIDFLEMRSDSLLNNLGKPLKPVYKEFGIRNESGTLRFSDFEDYSERKLSLKLSQFMLFKKYLMEHISSAVDKQAWSIDKPAINRKFLEDIFYRTYVTEFANAFGEWTAELTSNSRSFGPFNLAGGSALESLIMDRTVEKGLFKKKVDYALYDNTLSKKANGTTYPSAETKMIKLFFDATEEILTVHFGIKK